MSVAIIILICFIFILVSCKISKIINYYFRFFILILTCAIGSIIFVPFMLHRPQQSSNGLLPCWFCRVVCRFVLGLTFEVKGQEHIVAEGQGCVVVVNHQSALDVIVMSYLWPWIPRGYCIVKKAVFWYFPFGPAAWLWGTVYIDRLNQEQAQGTVNQIGQYIKDNQARLVIFPEGTRHSKEELLPFKKGAFHAALAAQCPIQPVVVSKFNFLDSDNYYFGTGSGVIEFLPAIPTLGMTRVNLDQLMDDTRSVMQHNFTRLSQVNNNTNKV